MGRPCGECARCIVNQTIGVCSRCQRIMIADFLLEGEEPETGEGLELHPACIEETRPVARWVA